MSEGSLHRAGSGDRNIPLGQAEGVVGNEKSPTVSSAAK